MQHRNLVRHHEGGDAVGNEDHGLTVQFKPDPTIFEETVFDFDTLKNRLREMAFLTKNLRIILRDDRVEAKAHMLDAYPNLQSMYSATDENTEVLYFVDAVATFSSFTEAPKVVEF